LPGGDNIFINSEHGETKQSMGNIIDPLISAPRPMHTQARGFTEPGQSHVDA
jgi:hypothetical protein